MQKGREQINKIKTSIENNKFIDYLKINNNYKIGFVVVSYNSIGLNSDLSLIPCIKYDHLIEKINNSSLSKCIDWLNNLEYLPIENKDFKRHYNIYKIGKYKLKWYYYIYQ